MQRYIGCLFCVAVVFILSGCFSEKSIDEQTPMQDTITLTPTVTPVPTEAADKNEISSYTTIFYDKNENRISNIKTASEELNHTVIYPDEVFSFNEVLGKRTKDKGYKEAPILSHGEKAKAGGGFVKSAARYIMQHCWPTWKLLKGTVIRKKCRMSPKVKMRP